MTPAKPFPPLNELGPESPHLSPAPFLRESDYEYDETRSRLEIALAELDTEHDRNIARKFFRFGFHRGAEVARGK